MRTKFDIGQVVYYDKRLITGKIHHIEINIYGEIMYSISDVSNTQKIITNIRENSLKPHK